MAILNYTTKIKPEKTAGEIQQILGKSGAQAVMSEYDQGEIVAVSFRFEMNGQLLSFRLPINDDCSCCGHESEDECIACEGEGRNKFGSLSGNDKKKVFSKTAYIDEITKDITLYSEWTGEDRIKAFVSAGFTVFQSITTRSEFIRPYDAQR